MIDSINTYFYRIINYENYTFDKNIFNNENLKGLISEFINEIVTKEFTSDKEWKTFNYNLSKEIFEKELDVKIVTAKTIDEVLNKNYSSEFGTLGLEICERESDKKAEVIRAGESGNCIVYINASNSEITDIENKANDNENVKFLSKGHESIVYLSKVSGTNFEVVNKLFAEFKEKSINVGVSFFKQCIDLNYAYQIAKECCKNSIEANKNKDKLFVDFHIIRGSDKSLLKVIREKNYYVRYLNSQRNTKLTCRPFDSEKFEEVSKVTNILIKNKAITNNDIKKLRDTLIVDFDDSNFYIKRINKKISKSEEKLNLLVKNESDTIYMDAIELWDEVKK